MQFSSGLQGVVFVARLADGRSYGRSDTRGDSRYHKRASSRSDCRGAGMRDGDRAATAGLQNGRSMGYNLCRGGLAT